MMESLLQVGIIILLFVFLRMFFKRVLPHIFFKCIWILCALKIWIPIPITLPSDVDHTSIFVETYQPSFVSIPTSTYPSMLHFLWLSITCFLLLFFIFQYWRLKKIVDCAIPLDNETYISDYIASPFAFGICKCKIIIPKNLNKEVLSYVMLHENMHKKYFDNGLKLFMLLTCCVFWFHPMVWVLRYVLNVDSEIVCDQSVVRSLPSNERKCYAQSILTCATFKRDMISSFCSQFTSHYYKERIENIMKYKKTTAFTFTFSLIMAGGILVVCASDNDMQLTQSISESGTKQTQTEEFDALSKCTTKEEYAELYMTLFPDAEMIYLFPEDFPEGSLPYQ